METFEVVTLIGVLASLGAVVVAIWAVISQGTALRRQLCLQSFSEYTRRYQELLSKVPSELLTGEFSQEMMHQHREKLTLVRAYFDLCFEEYYLSTKGFIEKDLWAIWLDGMEFAFSRPFISQAWWQIKSTIQYPAGFIEFVEKRVQPATI